MTLYKHTQYGKLLIAILCITNLTVILVLVSRISKPTPSWSVILVSSIFILTLLLFYKLTITITKEKIEATFGIGLIKRSMLIKDIEYSTIEEIKTPALYGIGIRLTPQGWLYNVKFGKAIKMKFKKKTFFVGTDDFETIHSVLKQLENN